MRYYLLLLTAIELGGCASSARINQFRSFAEIGRQQQVAVTAVVDEAITSNVDANSRQILDARDAIASTGSWGAIDPSAELDRSNNAVVATTRELNAIKRHAALLDRYFQAVAGLADYEATAIASSTETTVGALTALSPKLEALKVGDVTLPKAVGALAPVIVSNIKARALERELRAHADTINRELGLQERVLTFLATLITQDQALLSQRRIQDQLAEPYRDLKTPLPSEWIDNRRAILIGDANAAEPAAKAAETAAKMRQTFVSLCEGKASADDLAGYASDLSTLLTLVQVMSASPAKDGK